jgi:lysyl-tRNA synthetase class 2
VVRHADGSEHDLGGPWRSVTLHGAVSEVVGQDVTPDTSVEELRKLAAAYEIEVDDSLSAGEIVLELFEKLVEHTLYEPTFVRDYPVEVRPLARQHRSDPRLAEAWDVFIFGVEVGVAYSELVDPVVQRERLTAQSLRAAAGDAEAMQLDEDFLRAMEYGMPPMGGMGMGIDRLLMTLTGLGIREIILYPLVRSE